MNNLKNLAGNDASIFMFRFILSDDGIRFVVNKSIDVDCYEDLNEKMAPLVQACIYTFFRYTHLSVSDIIMEGNLFNTGEFEVVLSKGLDRYFQEKEKQQLFQDAKRIADLLYTAMNRRTNEEKEGKLVSPSNKHYAPDPTKIKQGLEELGRAKYLAAQLHWLAEEQSVRPALKQLRPEDLPPGVTASRSYDHRGQCITFAHETLGELGRIVLSKINDERTLLHGEIYLEEDRESPLAKQKKQIFDKIVANVTNRCNENSSE